MWDGLLHRNSFRNKCKTGLSRTKTRLEAIKKKRIATQKFLKKDIADLLKNNHDRYAYGRAEGLYIELNLSSCYDYVEQCCNCISEHLKRMHKERECPEECKVAVSSLVYAAARFADLPELRDLRIQFNEKYGKSLEPFVSQEFVEKLKPKPPTMEMKLQLMQEIAQEFSMTWNSLPLQQQLHTQGIDKPAKLVSGIDSGDKMPRSRSSAGHVKSKQEEGTEKLRTRRRNSYTGNNDDISGLWKEKNIKPEEKIETENIPNRKPFTNRIVPAPYVISAESVSDTKDEDTVSKAKEDNYPNLRDKTDDGLFTKAKPRPRSVRTKFLKQSVSSATSSSEFEIDVKESRSARVPQNSVFSDEDDDEDEVSRKSINIKRPLKIPITVRNISFPTSPEKGQSETPKSALPPPPGKRRYLFADSDECETPSSSGRSKFLPPDFEQPDSPIEGGISPIRNVKSESVLSGGGVAHVHPKMPSFDELAERVAALRKN